MVSSDLDLTHPWVEKYRVPVVSDVHHGATVIAALVVPDEVGGLYGLVAPDEDDAKLVQAFIVEYRNWFYNDRWLRLLDEKPVDFDGGVNTTTFAKHPTRGWLYNKVTWRGQVFAPDFNSERRFDTLRELMDDIHTSSYDGVLNERWVETLKDLGF